jgi:hypothetical protein
MKKKLIPAISAKDPANISQQTVPSQKESALFPIAGGQGQLEYLRHGA